MKHDQRYTVDEALTDPFFNVEKNEELKKDLEELEIKSGQKWLTSYEQLSQDEER